MPRRDRNSGLASQCPNGIVSKILARLIKILARLILLETLVLPRLPLIRLAVLAVIRPRFVNCLRPLLAWRATRTFSITDLTSSRVARVIDLTSSRVARVAALTSSSAVSFIHLISTA